MQATLNSNYVNAAKAVKSLNKQSGGLWKSIGMFVVEACYASGVPAVGTDIKPVFQEQEKLASAELKVVMGDNSTYRVVKNLLINCVAAGIQITDDKGNLKGKTELEGELKDSKTPKAAIEKFKAAIAAAEKSVDKLTAAELLMAAAMVDTMLKGITPKLKLAA